MAERYVSLAEVNSLLAVEKEKRGLLTLQNASMEHAKVMSRLSSEDAAKLVGELEAIPPVTEFTAVKIADVLPQFPVDLRAIFSKERVNLEPEAIEKILATVAKYM
ncbi:MAG: RNA polymerase Rpb4 family protein [Candidatus Methanomethylophilaceae archaeon]|nr:RNA polymerase Rpb4 family protein [Candidatus Methanomethylophilaceae archaeon]NCA73929.1 RNA polymerase [Gammaproteobacteria bacterium]